MMRSFQNLSVFLFTATLATASTTGFASESAHTPWVITLNMGPAWENAGKTQTLTLSPGVQKTYAADSNTQALFDGELFIGLQHALSGSTWGQFGFAVASTSAVTLSGDIWDDANPAFNNYSYSYQLQHNHLALQGKLLVDRNCGIIPWISGSLGVGFNHAYGFNSMPLIFQAVPTPAFSSNTSTTFTYTLSAGLQKVLNPHWQLGIAYEFANWGQSQLGLAAGQTTSATPSLSHVYTNGILFNVTYIP